MPPPASLGFPMRSLYQICVLSAIIGRLSYELQRIIMNLVIIFADTEDVKMNIKQPQWLDNAIFYEIYPQSFKDSNGDGIGDFRGIM